MSETQLERSVLEAKERDELFAIADALGAKPGARAKKADLVTQILRATGIEPDDGGGRSRSPTHQDPPDDTGAAKCGSAAPTPVPARAGSIHPAPSDGPPAVAAGSAAPRPDPATIGPAARGEHSPGRAAVRRQRRRPAAAFARGRLGAAQPTAGRASSTGPVEATPDGAVTDAPLAGRSHQPAGDGPG